MGGVSEAAEQDAAERERERELVDKIEVRDDEEKEEARPKTEPECGLLSFNMFHLLIVYSCKRVNDSPS